MILELIRLEENHDHGTFGILKINKQVFCWTLEPRDELNAPFISSIPAQQYTCKKVTSHKYGSVWEVEKVPGRLAILFHAGNVVENTQGCIILAQHLGKLKGDRAVLNSGATFKGFMYTTRNSIKLSLTIREVY